MATLSAPTLFISMLIIFTAAGNMVKGQQRCRENIGLCAEDCGVKCTQAFLHLEPEAICESNPHTFTSSCICSYNCGR
nr:hypothetical protein Iba_chr09dCG6680 [Ipomoea batatas]